MTILGKLSCRWNTTGPSSGEPSADSRVKSQVNSRPDLSVISADSFRPVGENDIGSDEEAGADTPAPDLNLADPCADFGDL
jgi:hypothetical protein